MGCKSALYSVNMNAQTLATGNINFGSVVRRYGNNVNLLNGNVVLEGSGYYDIDTNISFTGSATGSTTIALYKDGTVIPGATVTLTTEADGTYQVSIPTMVRLTCCKESGITAQVSGTSVTITNATIRVEK